MVTVVMEESSALEVATVAAALITSIVLAVQLKLFSAQARQDRVALAQSVAGRWDALEADWNIAHLVVKGPMDYYPVASRELRMAYKDALNADVEWAEKSRDLLIQDSELDELLSEAASKIENGDTVWDVEFVEKLELALWRNIKDWLPTRIESVLARSDRVEFAVSVHRILRFLAEISGQILRSELSPQLIYEVLGPIVARNGGLIRKMMQQSQEWVSYQPGLELRVLILIDMMWAEGARIGELDTQPNAEDVAEHKKTTGSGKVARKRVRTLVNRVSHKSWISKQWRTMLLTDLLRNAEHPSSILQGSIKFEPFEEADAEASDPGWDLREGNDDPVRIAWLQSAFVQGNRDDAWAVSALNASKTIAHLVKLRDIDGHPYDYWLEEE